MTDIEGKEACDALVKKPIDINPLFMEEILSRLEELILGTERIGRNAYQLLWRLMFHYKVNPNRGIKELQTHINQLNGYILYVPCDALGNRSKNKVKYS